MSGYKTGTAAVLRIKYVGVWDTVAAIGVPTDFFFAKYANKDEQFFDSDLSPLVVSARHAVAIDEYRTTFTPTLWPNFEDLNASLGFSSAASDAPYQQKWFPGHHGSVGGGGDIRGLSDGALVWVLDGAERIGLEVDRDPESPLFVVQPDDLASLDNMMPAPPSVQGEAEALLMRRAPRMHGPTRIEEVSPSALRRWREPKEHLPEHTVYRPKPLDGVADQIDAGHDSPVPQGNQDITRQLPKPTAGALYKVLYGDQLRRIAEEVYGHADCVAAIKNFNSTIDDINRIFVGQVIYLPPIEDALKVLPASKA